MDPDEYNDMADELKEQRNSQWRIHLEWMLENQPEYCRSLFKEKKLGRHLDLKYQQGLDLVMKLKEQGMSDSEAFEQAVQNVLAPPDGPAMSENPPQPVSAAERRQMLEVLTETLEQ